MAHSPQMVSPERRSLLGLTRSMWICSSSCSQPERHTCSRIKAVSRTDHTSIQSHLDNLEPVLELIRVAALQGHPPNEGYRRLPSVHRRHSSLHRTRLPNVLRTTDRLHHTPRRDWTSTVIDSPRSNGLNNIQCNPIFPVWTRCVLYGGPLDPYLAFTKDYAPMYLRA